METKLQKNTHETVRIAQISDIHWRGQHRHAEYTAAFESLFEQLKEADVHAIVCTGDIFHTKTQNITPEVIDKLVWMFRRLSEIAPLHMIPGNHDGNLANEDRQDVISPIINAMGGGYRTFFYKKSGVYPLITKGKLDSYNDYDQTWTEYEGLVQSGWLGVYSLFDKEGWSGVSPKAENGLFDIALFHGSVNGCMTDGDFLLSSCDMDVAFFQKYNIAMLGDIHKQQFLGLKASGPQKEMKPWIGYPGSLIQQDYGELEKKGWYLWTLGAGSYADKRWDVEFVELPNKMPFVTVPWLNDVPTTVKNLLDLYKNSIGNFRVRIATKQNISQPEVTLLYKEIKEKLGAYEVAFKQEKQTNVSTVETETVTISKHSLRNDTDALYKLYLEYIKNSGDKHVLNEEQLKNAETAIVGYVKKLNENPEEDVARDIIWSLKGIEFNNLYCYGEGNRVNFQNLNGIVGIFGDNQIGKSSLIGSLMYGLYNTTDRAAVKSAQIINRKKKEGSARVLINVGGTDYLIHRKTTKTPSKKRAVEDEDKAATTLQLYRLTPAGDMVELNSENDISRSDTDKVVRRLIGSSEDFLMTALSSQNDISRFIKAGATTRKEILNRFLDLDIFKKLYQFADKDFSDIEARIGKYNLADWETAMFQLKKQSEEKTLKIENIRNIISDLRLELEDKKLWLKNNQNLNQQDLNRQARLLESEVVSLQKEINRLNKSLDAAKADLEKFKKDLEILNVTISQEDITNLKETIDSLQKARKSLTDMKSALNMDKVKVESMKKSVRKLDTVPCGDAFPECRFIHDSHEDKKNLAAAEAALESLMESLQLAEKNVNAMEKENHEEKLRIHNQNLQTLAMLQHKIPSLEKEVELLTSNLEITVKTLNSKNESLVDLREKLDTINNSLFEEKAMEVRSFEKLISDKETELQNLLVSFGMDKNKIAQMDLQKEECKILLGELKIFDSVKEAFSKNGIPAMVLKTQLPAINIELEKILSGVTDFTVSLETEVNTVNTLDIFLTSEKKGKRVIELASGMEEMIASLALRVALINLSSLPKPDIFIIDESFGSLDSKNKPNCIRLLSSLKDRFKAIMVISHIPEIKEIADKIIEIKVGEDGSLIQV